jgi:hypothetical protein
MRKFTRAAIVLLILGVLGFTLRGWIYRQFVFYKSAGVRQEYSITQPELIRFVEEGASKQKLTDISDIINLSLSLTSRHLTFTSSENEVDPNKLVTLGRAHCVGYAHFFTAICNYLLQRNELSGEWKAISQIGHIYLFGNDIHKYFKTPFFKDHDFVTIKNQITGEIIAVDPTLNDYSWIKFIRYRHQ